METTVETRTPVTPARVMDLTFSFAATRALVAGVELDLFTRIAEGARTVEALAAAIPASAKGVRLLTDALAGLGLLEKDGTTLKLAPDAEMFLVKTSPGYLGPVVLHENLVWDRWLHLADTVRTGTADLAVEGEADSGEFFSHFVGALFNLAFPAARVAAEHLADGVSDVVDVGAGSAVWSQTVAMRNPSARLTILDYPKVLDRVTRPLLEKAGLLDRSSFIEGCFRSADLGEGRFDLAILGQILHSEGEERSMALLKRLHRALRPGGKLLVAEMIADEERATDRFALLFGLNMLLLTEQGDVFTRSDLERMGREAGFTGHEWLQAPAPYPLLVLKK